MDNDEPVLRQRRSPTRIERFFLHALLNLRPPRATPARWLVVVALLMGIGAMHDLAGKNIGLYTFFVLPCMFAAWSISRTAGFVTAALSAGIVFASDLQTYIAAPLIDLGIDASLRLSLYALVAWGTGAIGGLLQRLHELSRTDSLTGLANRREFLIRGGAEAQRARRAHRPFSVLFIDLDNFKSVNDTFGHAAGDALLRRVGALMKEQFRAIDIPARIGGDEFAAILPETNGFGALRIAQKLHQTMRTEFARMRCAVSSSIGAATFVRAPETFDDAVRRADELMYSVKRDSKDAIIQRDFPAS